MGRGAGRALGARAGERKGGSTDGQGGKGQDQERTSDRTAAREGEEKRCDGETREGKRETIGVWTADGVYGSTTRGWLNDVEQGQGVFVELWYWMGICVQDGRWDNDGQAMPDGGLFPNGRGGRTGETVGGDERKVDVAKL